jgi:Snf7
VNTRRAVAQLYTNKAHMIAMNTQLAEQLAMVRVAGSLSKSAEVMKLVNGLMKAPQLNATMMQMSREMMKAVRRCLWALPVLRGLPSCQTCTGWRVCGAANLWALSVFRETLKPRPHEHPRKLLLAAPSGALPCKGGLSVGLCGQGCLSQGCGHPRRIIMLTRDCFASPGRCRCASLRASSTRW